LSPANQARQISLFADEPACDPVYISTLAIDDQREREINTRASFLLFEQSIQNETYRP
jgi:hypothetical protein